MTRKKIVFARLIENQGGGGICPGRSCLYLASIVPPIFIEKWHAFHDMWKFNQFLTSGTSQFSMLPTSLRWGPSALLLQCICIDDAIHTLILQ